MTQPTASHPLRFGVIDESSQTKAMLLHRAQQAERLGYATFLLRDHFVAGEFAHQLAPIAGLMAAAAATTTLRIGSLVFANDYRHPAVLAKEAATIDVLSDGRFELGIGAGWLKAEYEETGLIFDPAGMRVERLRESVQILKALFGQEIVTYRGHHYSLTQYASFPKPVQRPRLPIMIGAGAKRMLELAAQEADIIGILPKAVAAGSISDDPAERLAETIEQKVAWIRDAAGERFRQIELSMVVSVMYTPHRAERAAQLIHERQWQGVTVEHVLAMPAMLIGTETEIAEKIQAVRARFGFSYFVVSDAAIETFAPLVQALTGK